MSETARRTSKGRKSGDLGICDAPKARPEGLSRCFGCGSFVEERGSSGEARRAEPTSQFLVASDQKRQILALVVSP